MIGGGSMSRVFQDMPWPKRVYFGIGLEVAYWYQRREDHPEREHHARAQLFVLMILAWMWPILLLAVLANLPNKPKGRENDPPPSG